MERFRTVRELGRGSYGRALLVEDRQEPGRMHVIKEIVVGTLAPREREAAEKEALLLSQMHHSNIVMYIQSFVHGDKLCIVMDYADGGDLGAALARRRKAKTPFSEAEAMRIFVQVCLALRHVHARNILHRDLKSQNIFLTGNGVVKLGDFGIARVLDSSKACARTQIGTPFYLSPEICEDQPYGRKSDVWALGVVLYEMLSLRVPFTASNLPALATKIVSQEPPELPPEYSAECRALVAALLRKDPKERPSIKHVLRTPYLQTHISRLLSYTIQTGTGGVAGASAGDAALPAAAAAVAVAPPSWQALEARQPPRQPERDAMVERAAERREAERKRAAERRSADVEAEKAAAAAAAARRRRRLDSPSFRERSGSGGGGGGGGGIVVRAGPRGAWGPTEVQHGGDDESRGSNDDASREERHSSGNGGGGYRAGSPVAEDYGNGAGAGASGYRAGSPNGAGGYRAGSPAAAAASEEERERREQRYYSNPGPTRAELESDAVRQEYLDRREAAAAIKRRVEEDLGRARRRSGDGNRPNGDGGGGPSGREASNGGNYRDSGNGGAYGGGNGAYGDHNDVGNGGYNGSYIAGYAPVQQRDRAALVRASGARAREVDAARRQHELLVAHEQMRAEKQALAVKLQKRNNGQQQAARIPGDGPRAASVAGAGVLEEPAEAKEQPPREEDEQPVKAPVSLDIDISDICGGGRVRHGAAPKPRLLRRSPSGAQRVVAASPDSPAEAEAKEAFDELGDDDSRSTPTALPSDNDSIRPSPAYSEDSRVTAWGRRGTPPVVPEHRRARSLGTNVNGSGGGAGGSNSSSSNVGNRSNSATKAGIAADKGEHGSSVVGAAAELLVMEEQARELETARRRSEREAARAQTREAFRALRRRRVLAARGENDVIVVATPKKPAAAAAGNGGEDGVALGEPNEALESSGLAGVSPVFAGAAAVAGTTQELPAAAIGMSASAVAALDEVERQLGAYIASQDSRGAAAACSKVVKAGSGIEGLDGEDEESADADVAGMVGDLAALLAEEDEASDEEK